VPFAPGQSGNPAGRPPGARNRATRLIETMLDGEADAIIRKVIDMAKAGDIHAIGLCLRWLYPPPKDRPVPFDMPRLETTADAVKAAAAIVKAVAAGELTPSEGVALSKLVENFARAVQVRDHAARLRKLEAESHKQKARPAPVQDRNAAAGQSSEWPGSALASTRHCIRIVFAMAAFIEHRCSIG
jgi:hypothetical protein